MRARWRAVRSPWPPPWRLRRHGRGGARRGELMVAKPPLPARPPLHPRRGQEDSRRGALVRAYEGERIAGLSRPTPGRATSSGGGGSFMDMGAHNIRHAGWILEDRVEEVAAMLSRQGVNLPKGEDNACP